jgi:hypothetical protein
MSTRRKIAVISVIAFGSSSVIVAAFRLIPLVELNSSADTSWVLGKMVIVAALEIQLAVIAVNLPSLKALWMRITHGSSSGSGQGNSNQKVYKLSSLDRKGERSARWGTGAKSKGSRGSITMLERGGVPSTESEEELFRQAGTSLQLPIQGKDDTHSGIKVTRDVNIMTSERTSDQGHPEYFVRGPLPRHE